MKINYKLQPGKKINKTEYDTNDYKELISIITPYYNDGKYIEQTANCVLNQSFPYFEWIIVDDGSTNKEDIDKLEELGKLDSRIKVFHKKNGGPAETRDFGAQQMSQQSKYILFLDSDDLIVDTYLECAYWTLETNKKATWTYTDTINFGGENYTWTKWYQPRKMLKENLLVITAMVRKEAFFEVNGFEIRDKNVYEDWCLWLKLINKGLFPVRMNFYGFWYRKKPKEESELQKSNNENKKKAMSYVNDIVEKIKKRTRKDIEFIKEGIQYAKDDYNWEYILDKNENIVIPKIKKDDKIKILMIIPWMVTGGADKFNLDIIKRSDKNKFDFTILTTEPQNNGWRQEFEQYAKVYDLTTFLDQKNWIMFINYLIEKNNIDIIFNTNSTFGYNAIPYLKVKHPKIPIIDYVHMEEWYNRNGGFSRDSSGVQSFIDRTYVCNQNSEKILIDYFKRKPNEIQTVYIGVDEKIFDPKLFNKEEILKSKNIDTKGKYVISYICRIAEQKRPYLLLKIIKELKEKQDNFIFVIAGDGPMLEGIKEKARQLKIYDNMIFLGNVKDTAQVYAISDLTINCSIKEGLALTAYESLAMGVPVVSCDVGGQKELISEDVGVIVPCLQKEEDIFDFDYKDEEIKPYVDGIIKVVKNLEKYKSNARKRILNGFTIDNMVENMTKIFEETKEKPNQEKIKNAQNMKENIDVTKELITKYMVSSKVEYSWLAENARKENVDIDWKYEKKENVLYENTIAYKIKHPIYVVLNKIHVYSFLKRILKRGEI